MTNGQAERALVLDPRVQQDVFLPEVRESDDFKTLMEFIARADNVGSLLVPVVGILVATRGDQLLRQLFVIALAVQQHQAYLELVAAGKEDARAAALKESAA